MTVPYAGEPQQPAKKLSASGCWVCGWPVNGAFALLIVEKDGEKSARRADVQCWHPKTGPMEKLDENGRTEKVTSWSWRR